MIQIGLPALPDSLSVATLPKNMLHSFLDWWRQVFLLVLLHPTRAGCLNCSFESPLYWFSLPSNLDTARPHLKESSSSMNNAYMNQLSQKNLTGWRPARVSAFGNQLRPACWRHLEAPH